MLTEGRVLGAERMATCISGGAGSWSGVDKVAQPENSGFPLRKWLRSWLRHAKVARVVVVDFGPSRNSGGSEPAPAHTLREFR
jgi:hypothetical protein